MWARSSWMRLAAVDEDQLRPMLRHRRLRHHSEGRDDDQVADGGAPRGRAIDRDVMPLPRSPQIA